MGHRVLRKEREKKEKQGLEEMKKNDPEGFAEYLQSVDKDRIKERGSLKHKGASQFMKKQAIFGKYDKDARQQVQDMLQKNKELTEKKIAVEESSDEEETAHTEMLVEEIDPTAGTANNPWMAPS